MQTTRPPSSGLWRGKELAPSKLKRPSSHPALIYFDHQRTTGPPIEILPLLTLFSQYYTIHFFSCTTTELRDPCKLVSGLPPPDPRDVFGVVPPVSFSSDVRSLSCLGSSVPSRHITAARSEESKRSTVIIIRQKYLLLEPRNREEGTRAALAQTHFSRIRIGMAALKRQAVLCKI